MSKSVWRFTVFVVLAMPAAGAQTTDTLRGKVTTDSGVVIAGAEVTATRAPDRAFKTALTDAAGNYQIIFEQGTADYLLHVSALGRTTQRLRVQRTATDTTLVRNFQLKSSVQHLETVTVDADVDKPARDRAVPTTDPGEAARTSDGVMAAIPLDLRGNIAATAATVPGVAMTTRGMSVLGMSPDQNRTTLNGMSFSGADLPRNVRTYTKVVTSSYDPALGWFGGADVDVEVEQGSIYTEFPVSLTLDAPALQYTDATSRKLGQTYGNAILGIGRSGSLANDGVRYLTGIDLGHRSSGFASLDRADADLLARSGVARDSATRLLGILAGAGIPIAPSRISDRTTDNLTLFGRLDRASYNFLANREEKNTWGVLGYARLSRSSLLGIDPTSVSMHGGDDREQIAAGQAQYTSFFHNNDFLTDVRASFSIKQDRSAPYLRLPDGRVLVSSELGDGLDATTSLGFGGNSGLFHDTREWTWETKDFTRFYATKKTHHLVQVTADSRVDGFTQSGAGNRYGTFTYNSLADVETNAPSSFSRALADPSSSVSEWNAFAAVADYWRKSTTFQLLAGARLEANRFLARPDFNPLVEQTFGVRNDAMPQSIHISPRIGFTWVRQPGGEGVMNNGLGTFSMGNIGYLRGGIGEFRAFLAPRNALQVVSANGLPGGAAYLTCIGDATPVPDWAGYALDPTSIPDRCANGGPPAFADAAPAVVLFDKSYQQARSWRGNLSYASNMGPLIYTIDGIYSLNLNQPGRVDLNFNNLPRFTATGESRPVFADANNIVPGSGLATGVDARKSALFGEVISNRSDLRSISRQVTFDLAPNTQRIQSWYMSLAYTLSSTHALASGFDAPTFGSPTKREWSRGEFDSRHRIQIQAGKFIKRVSLSLYGVFQSGLPFTPIVG